MWLPSIPWAQRVWALPFLTALAPPASWYEAQGRAPKKLTDWARQLIGQLRRWLPDRPLVVVADGAYAALALLHWCGQLARPVTMIVRLRLDAALYAPAPPRRPGHLGRPRLKGARLPTLHQRLTDPTTSWTRLSLAWYGQTTRQVELASDTTVWYHAGKPPVPIRWVLIRDPQDEFLPQALLCTDQTLAPIQIVTWFRHRWQVEVTFQEVRAHLGVETQSFRGRMVRPGYRPHDARPLGAVLLDYPGHSGAHRPALAAYPHGRVVSQAAPHLRRRDRSGASPLVALRDFFHLGPGPRHGKNTSPIAASPDRNPLLRRLICTKSRGCSRPLGARGKPAREWFPEWFSGNVEGAVTAATVAFLLHWLAMIRPSGETCTAGALIGSCSLYPANTCVIWIWACSPSSDCALNCTSAFATDCCIVHHQAACSGIARWGS
ncbi:MAG: transposase [Planctomycetota bacterium]|nr:transposase [Planctomycetota bacterium]